MAAIDLQALSGRIKAEETACDLLRASIAEPGANAGSLQLALACKEKWLRESRALYAQEYEKQRRFIRVNGKLSACAWE